MHSTQSIAVDIFGRALPHQGARLSAENQGVHHEQQLVERAQAGDASAAGLLYESYFPKVYRYVVLRVGEPATAEDITEDVFLKMLEAIGSFRFTGAPFSSWLFRIAHNQVIDHHRRRGKGQPAPVDEGIAAPGNADPAVGAPARLHFGELREALQRVTTAQQQVVALRFAAGLSIAETARVMGRSQGAIKALQHSAVQALRRLLAQGGSDLGQTEDYER